MSNHLTVAGRRYDRFHVIHNGDLGAGFSALITYALNGVRRSEAQSWLPIVHFSAKQTPHFYDPEHGDNVWEYYFEPVASVSYAQLRSWLEVGEVLPEQVHQYSDREVVYWHVNDRERLTTFWAKDEVVDRRQWMQDKRRLGRKYVGRYIRLKPHVIAKLEHHFAALIKPRFTFGVHIRGTDFYYAQPTDPEQYFRAINAKAEELGLADYRIFVATDQTQFVTAFEKRFPGRVVTYDAARSDNDVAPFRLSNVRPYKKGEDVLLDILLLSRCQFLFKSVSAVGEYAMWFNPLLECEDFALTSEFKQDKTMFSKGAYLMLDVDNKGPLRVTLLIWMRFGSQVLQGAWRRLRSLIAS